MSYHIIQYHMIVCLYWFIIILYYIMIIHLCMYKYNVYTYIYIYICPVATHHLWEHVSLEPLINLIRLDWVKSLPPLFLGRGWNSSELTCDGRRALSPPDPEMQNWPPGCGHLVKHLRRQLFFNHPHLLNRQVVRILPSELKLHSPRDSSWLFSLLRSLTCAAGNSSLERCPSHLLCLEVFGFPILGGSTSQKPNGSRD